MATVRFSNQLHNEIIEKAKEMFAPKIEAIVKEVPSHWADHVYLKMFGQENIDKMNALPMEYFDTVTDFKFKGFTKEHNSSRGTVLPKICNADNFDPDNLNEPSDSSSWSLHTWNSGRDSMPELTLKLPKQLRYSTTLPDGVKGLDSGSRWAGAVSVTLLAQDDRWTTMWEEWVDLRMKFEGVLYSRKKFISGVKKIITTYSTLGPALKVFPGLWDLIPDKYKEKHKTEDKRANVKKVAQDLSDSIDVNSLTAQVTVHKLTK